MQRSPSHTPKATIPAPGHVTEVTFTEKYKVNSSGTITDDVVTVFEQDNVDQSNTAYNSLPSKASSNKDRKFDENEDLDDAADCMDATKRIASTIVDQVSACCSSCCMNCAKCLRAVGECFSSFAKAAAVNGYNGLIRPIGSGVGEFFRAKNGELRWYQPGIDLTAGAIGNPVTTLLVDPFFVVDRENKSHLFPLANPAGRIMEFFNFLINAAHGVDKRKNLVAAVAVVTLSGYFMLTTAGEADAIGRHSWDAVNPLKVLNPAMGIRAIEHLLKGHPELWQKIVVPLAAYVGLTNGFAAGKKIATTDFSAWLTKFRSDISKDSFERHLDALANMDEESAKRAQATYTQTIQQGKDWKSVDVFGRGLEALLKLPAHVFQAPSRNLWNITGAKAVLAAGGALKRHKDTAKEKLHNVKERIKATKCMTGFLDCIGRKPDTEIDNEPGEVKEAKAPSYEQLLDQKKREFSLSTAATNRLIGAATRDHVGNGRQTALNRELEATYIQAVMNHHYDPDLEPGMVLPSAPPPPYQEAWAEKAKANPDIQKMLVGEFPNPTASRVDKAVLYNNAMYLARQGKSNEIPALMDAAKPAHHAGEEAELTIRIDGSAPPPASMSPRR